MREKMFLLIWQMPDDPPFERDPPLEPYGPPTRPKKFTPTN